MTNSLTNKTAQEIAEEIETKVKSENRSYMEAILEFMDDYEVSFSNVTKIVPMPVIEKLKVEILQSGVLRPSLTKELTSNSLFD